MIRNIKDGITLKEVPTGSIHPSPNTKLIIQ
jgi:hypothetical protein